MEKFVTREELFKNILPKYVDGRGVEVGVFKGFFSKTLLSMWGGTLYMVDIWKPQNFEDYQDQSNNIFHQDALTTTMANISGYEDRAIMIRADSFAAAQIFENESLDFIYLDSNHTYEHVKKELEVWYKKLKPGGFFSGHDYLDLDWYNDPNYSVETKNLHIWSDTYLGLFGVNPAVDEFCKKRGYTLETTNEFLGTWWFIK
jgi:SAM-dependent methyltransferase